ncbi:hypothetical protein CS022_20910 [Veronia nyctiphanis]|uniref:DUF2919 domain-containing protein n=1 Tax=Veronia nyctiphanis TaxID=1278244 RepID=A0A4Q0YLZ5_9GAMM|nr:DUF2919 domain-containing protein [Veronia nyctiphanis]RXJ71443.1 hypothetical protein CS022_20910 [Veronia nyctiphanis]
MESSMLLENPDHFDKHGNRKAPVLYLLVSVFLARAWWVFILAGASRQQGESILSLLYPDKYALYTGLVTGLPAICMMLMTGSQHRFPSWLKNKWQHFWWCLPVSCVVDLAIQVRHMNVLHWQFQWSAAVTLLVGVWMTFYIFKSRRVRSLFCALD